MSIYSRFEVLTLRPMSPLDKFLDTRCTASSKTLLRQSDSWRHLFCMRRSRIKAAANACSRRERWYGCGSIAQDARPLGGVCGAPRRPLGGALSSSACGASMAPCGTSPPRRRFLLMQTSQSQSSPSSDMTEISLTGTVRYTVKGYTYHLGLEMATEQAS